MSGPYTEKFNVLEVFEQNPYQKIMMGAKIDQPDDVVVINVFKKAGRVDATFKEALETNLDNLIHLEDTEEELIVVTEYKEGIALPHYLESFSSVLDDRANLAFDFLKKISRYDAFDPYFTSIFVDDNQVIVQDGELLLNELIIVDKQIEGDSSFESVVTKVSNALKLILTHGVQKPDELMERKVGAFIGDLTEKPHTYHSIQDINIAFKNAFIYEKPAEDDDTGAGAAAAGAAVGAATGMDASADDTIIQMESADQPLDTPPSEAPPVEGAAEGTPVEEGPKTPEEKEIELDGLEVVDELFTDLEEEEKKPNRNVALVVILAALAAIAGFLIFFNPFGAKDLEPPVAAFEFTKEDNVYRFVNESTAFGEGNEITASKWEVFKEINGEKESIFTSDKLHFSLSLRNEGDYTVTLTVQDKYEQWSEPAQRSFTYVSESITDIEEDVAEDEDTATPTEKLDKFTTTYGGDNVSDDDDIYRSGTRSIMLDLTGDKGTGQITLEDVFIDNSTILSLWILSDRTDPIKITFEGYNGNTLVFSRELTHVPRTANTWDMVEAKVDSKMADRLVITFHAPGSKLWVDDIEISSYK